MKILFCIILFIFSFPIFAQDGLSIILNDDFENTSETSSLVNSGEMNTGSKENFKAASLNKNTTDNAINKELTSNLLKQRLEYLNKKTPFNVEYNATVDRFIRLYLKTRKNDLSNLMDKAKYYFPIFEERLDKYNLPLEIKYLAVVESALEPSSKSHAGAKGLWQFMYNTGKQYGLKISSYVDERSDPIKATEAACKYLQSLYKRFNDWDLALAAYNSGPGNVSKAIRRSGGLRNYWNIRQYLPAETRGYLPAFYTTFYLFEYGPEHHIYPNDSKITFFDTDTIHVKRKLSFLKIEQEIGIDKTILKELNPQYKLGIIPVNGNSNILTLPKNFILKFVRNEYKIYNLPKLQKREASDHIDPNTINSYVVQRGDNLPRIAHKFDIRLSQLKIWNGLQTNYIIAGQSLVVSSESKNVKKTKKTQKIISADVRKMSSENQVTTLKNFQLYTVKIGDSLFKISRLFPNVSINKLRKWNNLWGISHIIPGTQLKILTQSR